MLYVGGTGGQARIFSLFYYRRSLSKAGAGGGREVEGRRGLSALRSPRIDSHRKPEFGPINVASATRFGAATAQCAATRPTVKEKPSRSGVGGFVRSYPLSLCPRQSGSGQIGIGRGRGRGGTERGGEGSRRRRSAGRRAGSRAVIGAIHSLGMVVSSAILGNS